jgi:RimJ/RimL family protein N-acetyltransferase
MTMQEVLLDFPESFDTERLTIRCPRPGDGPEFNAATLESWDRLQPWFVWAMEPPTVEENEIRLRQARAKFMTREDLWLLLFLKGTKTLIGSSGLHSIDWSVPKFEIGYWVRTGYEGQGYITEAVEAIADFAFETLGARRIKIRCNIDNLRSAAVARRAGFDFEGTNRCIRRHHLSRELVDEMVFSRIRRDAQEQD